MTIYSVEFRTDRDIAAKEIDANSAADALRKAKELASVHSAELCFLPYESTAPVNEITIQDAEGDEVGLWRDEELLLRLAARDLLDAGRAVVARWERGDLAEAVRSLAAAIAKAEQRA